MKKTITIVMMMFAVLTASAQLTTIRVDCSDAAADTSSGVINIDDNSWSVEIYNDSVNTTDTAVIDFKASNSRTATFANLAPLIFSSGDTIPYTFGTGQINYYFEQSKDRGAARYLHWYATCGGDTTSILKAIYNE